MKKILVTGAGGTVGTAVRQVTPSGVELVAWPRNQVSPAIPADCLSFLERHQPQAIIHLAIPSRPGPQEDESEVVFRRWPSLLSRWASQHSAVFLLVSSVMVWSDSQSGPFTPYHSTQPSDGYGVAKKQTEEAVFAQNPFAKVIRIGWQIGEGVGSNNMLDFLESSYQREGCLKPSLLWYPATSALLDTATAIWRAVWQEPGLGQSRIFLCDSNRGWNFAEIVQALKEKHGKSWAIQPEHSHRHDQRMVDGRLEVPALDVRLPWLRALTLSETASIVRP